MGGKQVLPAPEVGRNHDKGRQCVRGEGACRSEASSEKRPCLLRKQVLTWLRWAVWHPPLPRVLLGKVSAHPF